MFQNFKDIRFAKCSTLIIAVTAIATYSDYLTNKDALCFKSDTKVNIYVGIKKYINNL